MTGPDTEQFEAAARSVRLAITPDSPWLQPEGESHLLSPEVLLATSSAIVGAFGKGVSAAALGVLEDWGKQSTKWLAEKMFQPRSLAPKLTMFYGEHRAET